MVNYPTLVEPTCSSINMCKRDSSTKICRVYQLGIAREHHQIKIVPEYCHPLMSIRCDGHVGCISADIITAGKGEVSWIIYLPSPPGHVYIVTIINEECSRRYVGVY